MKFISWTLVFLLSMSGIILYTQNIDLKNKNSFQEYEIKCLQKKVEKYETDLKNIEWLQSELDAIDAYISVIDQLKFSGMKKFPDLERTAAELNEARYDVIKKAIYWDRELNKREEEK